MTSPIDAPWALFHRLPIRHEPINRLVSAIFSIKVAYTHRQTRRRIIRVA